MKRLIVIVGCLSILYGSAVWAIEGCREFGAGIDHGHHAENAESNHHAANAPSHHSHSERSKVHCPNVFGEFLVSSRLSLTTEHSSVYHTAFANDSSHDLINFKIMSQSPPGSVFSKAFPRHLLLSVIRI
jgi:hypothetical protein